MSDNVFVFLESGSSFIFMNCSIFLVILQFGVVIKFWCSKFFSVKYSVMVFMFLVKFFGFEVFRFIFEVMKLVFNNQKFMLEKLKFFNSKGGLKVGEGLGFWDISCEWLEILFSFEESEELEVVSCMFIIVGFVFSSFKIVFKGIVQRIFSWVLINKKSFLKGNEKEKEK